MRISDWSSDVCSSDLPEGGPDACAPLLPGRSRAAIIKQAWTLGANNPVDDSPCPIPYQHDPHIHRLWMACELAMGGGRRRSAARHVGKECVRKCRSRRAPVNITEQPRYNVTANII